MISQKNYADHSGLSRGRVSQLRRQGLPLDSLEAADAWRGMTARQRPEASAAPPGGPLRCSQPAPDLEGAAESIRAAWGRLERCERVAFEMLEAALTEGRPDAGRLVAIHAAAVRNLADGRGRLLDLAERERELVSGSWVRRVMQQHDGVVAQLAKAMPRSLASRVNPADPEHAQSELIRWLNETFLAALSATDPWKT
jgi:hypothetical protein